MQKKILFRADGNAETGLGHLYRLFSLVEIVKDHFNVVFLTKEESTTDVIPKDYKVLKIPKHITIIEEPKWINASFSSENHVIIADGYHFGSKYQNEIKHHGFKLIYIDDLAKETMFADIVINHSPYLKKSDYDIQPYTQLALGTSYALLRPSFLNAAKHKRKINNINTAFVCFGGSDPFNLTHKAVKGLLSIDSIKKIHVVLGGAYNHKELSVLTRTHHKNLSIHRNLSEQQLITVMQLSQIAIAPASTILYELCCIKMPVLSGFYVDNQELIYKGFSEKGAIYQGGNLKGYLVSDFINQIRTILEHNDHNSMLLAQSLLFDEKIEERLMNLIKQLC